MKNYIVAGLALFSLAACAGSELALPTPSSAGLPQPSQVILANPGDLDNSELCAYITTLDETKQAWEDYANGWLALFGREPVDLARLAGAEDIAENLAEARGIACVE